MKKCENCENEHDGTFGSGRFCSKKCARGFSTKNKRSLINKSVSKKLRKRDLNKICPQCNNSFEVKRINQICCSLKCSHKYIMNDSLKQLLSEKNTGKTGGYRQNSGRGKKSWYDSPIAGKVYLQSSWELKYAQYLDENKIEWQRNNKRFYYNDGVKQRYYIPDFYLNEEDIFIEIKGYKVPLDELKWKDFKNLKILYKEDLKKLKIL